VARQIYILAQLLVFLTGLIPGTGKDRDARHGRRGTHWHGDAPVRLHLGRAIRQAMTVEQVVNANLLPDLDQVWGKGFLAPARFTTIAYPG
jgi:hypothetical protein